MIAKKDQKATDAQAKALAFALAERAAAGGGLTVASDPDAHIDATTRKMVEMGWIAPNGTKGHFVAGRPFERHSITPAGEDALCWWLTKRHQNRA